MPECEHDVKPSGANPVIASEGCLMRNVELTDSEWQSLNDLQGKINNEVSRSQRAKFLLLGLIAEKAGNLVLTFEGRLQLREYNEKLS